MRLRRGHILALGVGAVTVAILAAGIRYGFADTTASSVCSGSVTFFNESAGPAATSNKFPVGTRLRITNLDNNKSTTVTVTGVSGSCILLNNAAMDLVREPGKNVIRRNVVTRVAGGAAAAPGGAVPGGAVPGGAVPGGAGQATAPGSVCTGPVTFFNENAGPAATSNQFPVGTRLRITNLDNNNSTTVTITGVSGSCILLNNAAMDLVREPGKNVIRRNIVTRAG